MAMQGVPASPLVNRQQSRAAMGLGKMSQAPQSLYPGPRKKKRLSMQPESPEVPDKKLRATKAIGSKRIL